MKNFYTLLLAALLITSITDTSAQTTPCTLTGGVVTVPYSAPPIMMNATVNGMSQYTYAWNDGTPVGSSNQKPFYSGWCVTITDISTGCDTTICESCIPNGGSGPCTMIYMPVCGCDGNIYNNDCMAMQQGIFTYTSAIGPNGTTLPCSTPSWDCIANACVDPGNGNGTYTTLSDCQANCNVTPTWDCVNGTCVDPGTGLGAYPSPQACQVSCSVLPTWNCVNGACIDPGTGQGAYNNYNTCVTTCSVVNPSWDCVNGVCTDPGTGNGQYSSLSYCQSNCNASSWDCVNNFCFDPGTGNGAYATLGACDTACTIILPSWDCTLLQGCIDPGTGQGIYSSLSACDSICSVTAINEENVKFKIYPNPAKSTLKIIGIYTSASIYDVFGKVVLTSDYKNIIDVETLSNGIYFIHIFVDNEITIKRITIAK